MSLIIIWRGQEKGREAAGGGGGEGMDGAQGKAREGERREGGREVREGGGGRGREDNRQAELLFRKSNLLVGCLLQSS